MERYLDRFPPMVTSGNEAGGYYAEALFSALVERHGPYASISDLTTDSVKISRLLAIDRFSRAAVYLIDNGYFPNGDEARDFLDSRSGRYLHDTALDYGGEIGKVKWLKQGVEDYKITVVNEGGEPTHGATRSSNMRNTVLGKPISSEIANSILRHAGLPGYFREDGTYVMKRSD